MSEIRRQFASDNNAGALPEVIAALQEANVGHVAGYGHDAITERARARIAEIFETECAVYFVSNGTTANCLALAPFLQPYGAVLSHRHSHLETDECNALGFFSPGVKVLVLDGAEGKIAPENIGAMVAAQREIHSSKPLVLSLTNATEVGTVYCPAEVEHLSSVAREHGLHLHLDGARFANALAFLKSSPAELSWRAGVQSLSLGGTKNGLMFGEAIVFFERALAGAFEYRMKQAGQLASKMRFLAAQWLGVLQDDRWLRHAAHANAMAQRLTARLQHLGLPSLFPTQANAVFVALPDRVVQRLYQAGFYFYTGVGPENAARLMCAWDTTEEDVDRFADAIATARSEPTTLETGFVPKAAV